MTWIILYILLSLVFNAQRGWKAIAYFIASCLMQENIKTILHQMQLENPQSQTPNKPQRSVLKIMHFCTCNYQNHFPQGHVTMQLCLCNHRVYPKIKYLKQTRKSNSHWRSFPKICLKLYLTFLFPNIFHPPWIF